MAMGVLLHDAAAVAFRNRAAMQRADTGSMADHSNSRCAAIMQREFIPTPHPFSSPVTAGAQWGTASQMSASKSRMQLLGRQAVVVRADRRRTTGL